jgi:hypothetical protein
VKKYPPPKKTSSVRYVFGALKAAQSQYAKGHTRLKKAEPSKPLSADEMLKQVRGNNERKTR